MKNKKQTQHSKLYLCSLYFVARKKNREKKSLLLLLDGPIMKLISSQVNVFPDNNNQLKS